MTHKSSNAAPYFSQEIIDTLAKDFSISAVQKPNLEFMLNQGAQMYFRTKEVNESTVKPAEHRAILDKLRRRAVALRETLDELPRDAVRSFDEITSYDSLEILEKGGRAFHDQPTLTLEPLEAVPGETITTIEISDLIQYLDAIARLSVETKEKLPDAELGRPTDHALEIWIANLAHLWTKKLGREFTRDDLGGGIPLSQAAEFCSRASSYLDDKIPGTLIMKSMKRYIKNNK